MLSYHINAGGNANAASDVGLIASSVLAENDSDEEEQLPAVGDETAHGYVGMIRKSIREERRKRSTAYDHTALYKVVEDQSGVEFEVRSCKYCATMFSFKGGTTSASLRHLKSAHPQEFFEGSNIPVAVRSKSPGTVGGFGGAVGGSVGTVGTVGGSVHGKSTADAENLDQDGELRSDLNADADQELPTPKPLEKSSVSNKRSRYDGDYVGGKPTRLTANQHAITHFLGHYKVLMDVRMRLAFIKHLSYNDREAEMYNVLDEETRLEYVTQFANDQIQAEASRGL